MKMEPIKILIKAFIFLSFVCCHDRKDSQDIQKIKLVENKSSFTNVEIISIDQKNKLDTIRKDIILNEEELPFSLSARGLFYLQPYPLSYKITLSNIDLIKYKCFISDEGLVCTGCYEGSGDAGKMDGNLSVLCPLRSNNACLLLRLDQWTLQGYYGVPIQECPGSLW